jgi:hypothetical protein
MAAEEVTEKEQAANDSKQRQWQRDSARGCGGSGFVSGRRILVLFGAELDSGEALLGFASAFNAIDQSTTEEVFHVLD